MKNEFEEISGVSLQGHVREENAFKFPFTFASPALYGSTENSTLERVVNVIVFVPAFSVGFEKRIRLKPDFISRENNDGVALIPAAIGFFSWSMPTKTIHVLLLYHYSFFQSLT